MSVASNDAQRQAVSQAHDGFEQWVLTVYKETATYEVGDQRGAIDASPGASRLLRKGYEQSLARAQRLDISELETTQSSIAADSSRSVRLLVLWLGVALVIGVAVAFWLVRAIAAPVAELVALLSVIAHPSSVP